MASFAGNWTSDMTTRSSRVLLLCLIFFLLPCFSFADDAADLWSKIFQQSNVWAAQQPVQVDAKLHATRAKGGDLNFEYVLYWAAPDKWRVEWSGSGYTEKSVLSGGKLYRYRSSPVPPIQELAFNQALGFALGNGPAAPLYFAFSPFGLEASKDEFQGKPLECLGKKGYRACLDSATMRLVQFEYGRIISTYSRYGAGGDVPYPQAIHIITSEGKTLADAEVSVSRPSSFAPSMFSPPAEGTSFEYGECSGNGGITGGPIVEHRVPPKRRMTSVEGTVWLYVAVGADGSVVRVATYSAPSSDLSGPAMQAVRQWKFRPASHCGTQVPSEIILPFTFLFRYD